MPNLPQLHSRRASYSPDRLEILGSAFDRAWEDIAGNFGEGSPATIDAARTTLANVILNLPCSGTDGADRIKETALRVMAAGCREDLHRRDRQRSSLV
jgi:hypothetical protein